MRPRRSIGMIVLNTCLSLLALGLTLALIFGLAVTWYLGRNIDPVFEEGASETFVTAGASHLYYYRFDDRAARQGERVALPDGTLDGGMHVIPVTYGECPPALIHAFVAIEDQQFFEHHGVNWGRTATAALNYCLVSDFVSASSSPSLHPVQNKISNIT